MIETRRTATQHNFQEVLQALIVIDQGRYGITASSDNSIRFTNLITGDERYRIKDVHRSSYPNAIALTTSGFLISCGKNGEIRVFE